MARRQYQNNEQYLRSKPVAAEKPRKKTMLTEFKTFTKDRLDMAELVSLAAFGRAYKAEFEEQGVDVPEFVKDQNAALSREIQSRVAEAKAARVKSIKATLHGLKTASERRAELEAELAALEPATTA